MVGAFFYTCMNTHTHTHALPHINPTEWKLSGPTSSGQPSNPKANYKPHYVLSLLFPHHINSAMRLDRLKTDVKWRSRAKMSPVLHFNRPPTLSLLLWLNSVCLEASQESQKPSRRLCRADGCFENKHQPVRNISWRNKFGICLAFTYARTEKNNRVSVLVQVTKQNFMRLIGKSIGWTMEKHRTMVLVWCTVYFCWLNMEHTATPPSYRNWYPLTFTHTHTGHRSGLIWHPQSVLGAIAGRLMILCKASVNLMTDAFHCGLCSPITAASPAWLNCSLNRVHLTVSPNPIDVPAPFPPEDARASHSSALRFAEV